jgi:uncharacterized protein YecE (DUF72 family)
LRATRYLDQRKGSVNTVYIGTSGWVYKDWQKHFYPADLPAKRQFQFYATQFPTVEINATFYRLPTLKMVKGWRDKAPPGFVFAVKGSRFITHILKISGASRGLRKYFSRIKPLQKRIGPVLWQLPPFMKKSPERLEKFLKILPKDYCHAVEFRHASWYEGKDAFDLLRKYKAAHVNLSSLRMPMNLTATADFVYIRFHGLENGAAHDYTRAELEPWARFIRRQSRAGKNVYAYFNNDLNVHAPDNAKMLMEMIGKAARRADR